MSQRVTFGCSACGVTVTRFASQLRGKAYNYCGRACMYGHGLKSVVCAWPKCSEQLKARVFLKKTRGSTYLAYKTDLRRTGNYTRHPLCQEHSRLVNARLGADARVTNGRLRILDDPDCEYDSRAISNRFTRLVVFEASAGCCQDCGVGQEWQAPGKTWEIDHKVPVYKGGRTRLDNLQMLCRACHDRKTAVEKSEVSKLRYAGQSNGRATRWMTHYEKNELIARLREEIAALKAQIANPPG